MSPPAIQRILFVEDDPDIQIIARIALEDVGGFTVALCRSGQEAIKKAPDFGPDLILLDMMMPGMDGLTTLGRLREFPRVAQTPVIFMTARAQPQEVAAYRSQGAIGVIAKPFDAMQLPEKLRQICCEAGL